MSKGPRVIKASELTGLRPVEFNTIDTLADLQAKLQAARQEVEAMQQAARLEIQQAHETAFREAYQKGYAEGFKKGESDAAAARQSRLEAEIGNRLETSVPALRELVGEIRRNVDSWVGQWEHEIANLACQIAERILRRETSVLNDTARRTIQDLARLIGRCPRLTVFLNPADAETFAMEQGGLAELRRLCGEVRLVADPEISQGGCRLETDFGAIDARLETQLSRIAAELTGNRP